MLAHVSLPADRFEPQGYQYFVITEERLLYVDLTSRDKKLPAGIRLNQISLAYADGETAPFFAEQHLQLYAQHVRVRYERNTEPGKESAAPETGNIGALLSGC